MIAPSTKSPPASQDVDYFWTQEPSYADYPPLNKPSSISAWIQGAQLSGAEPVLILDPDCIFVSAIAEQPSQGHPWGTPVPGWLSPDQSDALRAMVDRHGSVAKVDQVSVPILITAGDLEALAPLWLSKTLDILADPEGRAAAGWVVEMWAYAMASNELGLQHQQVYLSEDQPLQAYTAQTPIVHYAYESSYKDWHFYKHGYHPWDYVPAPPSGAPWAITAFAQTIDDYILSMQQFVPLVH